MNQMFLCVVNPSARSGRGGGIWGKLRQALEQRNIGYEVIFTRGPEHAVQAVRERTSRDPEEQLDIIVVGGDGTLNEVLTGICDLSRVRLGLVPVGSGNDFARDLDLPKDPARLIERICNAQVRRHLDVGVLTYIDMEGQRSRLGIEPEQTRRFGVSAGIGFDAAVCEEALASEIKNRLNRIGLGKLAYGAIAVRAIARAPRIPCDITIEDGAHRETIHLEHFLFIAAMIHHYEGGGFRFAPAAALSDGRFDMCIIGQMPVPMMFLAMPFAYFGRHYGFREVYHRLGGRVHIRTQEPMWVHTDGEVLTKSRELTFECQKEALALLV